MVTLNINNVLNVTAEPVDAQQCEASDTSFTVTANCSGTLSFQWQKSSDGGSTFANESDAGVVSGTATNTLDISDVAGLDANQYRCVVSVVGGADVTSSAATLTVT